MNRLHYGVVVGINRYRDLGHLRLARGDAERFAEWLVDPDGGGLPPENVVKVVDSDVQPFNGSGRNAARPNRSDVYEEIYAVRKKVEDHVEERPGDWLQTRLYFYASGHGIAHDVKDAALLMADAGPDWYGENISCAKLLTFFGKCQSFHEVVVFADCCRERVANAPIIDVPWTLEERDNGQVISVLGCATYFGDSAYEPPQTECSDKHRGYFTQALLEGLQEAAADPHTGKIDSNGLASYVRQRVRNLTSHFERPQTPTMEADPAAPLIFRNRPGERKPITHEVRLSFTQSTPGAATLRDGSQKILGRHETAAGVWTVRLPNGIYEVTVKGAKLNNDGLFKVFGEDKNVEL